MTTPPRRILVGTDFSTASQHAVDRAVALAKLWSVPLVLHHVASASFWGSPPDQTSQSSRIGPRRCDMTSSRAE